MRTDLIFLIPEITLLLMACLVLIVDAFSKDPLHKMTYRMAQLSLVLTLSAVIYYSPDYSYIAFNGGFITDTMSTLLKSFICAITIVVFFYSYEYLKENELLKMLLNHLNDLMPRELALVKIWNDDNYFTSRSMDVYIAKIRKYLSKDSRIEIENIHGEGFRMIVK